jgi:hypothetical protein
MASVEAAPQAIARLDARPILPVSTTTVWDEAIRLRDRLGAVVATTLAQEGVDALLIKSQAGNYPAWIRLEAWLPDPLDRPGVHERCDLELIIDSNPFSKHQLVYTARLSKGKRAIALNERTRFSEAEMAQWTRYAIGRGSKPSNYHPRLDALLDAIGALIPPLRPRYNPLASTYRNRLIEARTIAAGFLCALLIVALLYRPLLAFVAIGIGALTLAAALALPFLTGRYRQRDWVVPQPRETPRHLGHVDSWHAVLSGLSGEAENLKRRITDRLLEGSADGFSPRLENFAHRTANGADERERLVVTHGQGQVHIHVHPVADDLFIGWQAHLNWAKWSETGPVANRDAGTHGVAYRDLKPSWYYPSEFDLIDLESLSAVVHGALEREVKALLKERAIDQEVDFEVNRGDRGNALDARKAWPERASERKRDSNRIFASTAVRRASLGEMQLAPADVQPATARQGLARVPAVILLPVITALGYFWLGPFPTWRLEAPPLIQDLPFVFTPLFHLPFAVALAFGLWLYGGVRFTHALLVIALVEVFALGTTYLYHVAWSYFITRRDLASPPVVFSFTIGATLVSSLSYLLAASIWAPKLRAEKRWLAAILLGPHGAWLRAGRSASFALQARPRSCSCGACACSWRPASDTGCGATPAARAGRCAAWQARDRRQRRVARGWARQRRGRSSRGMAGRWPRSACC